MNGCRLNGGGSGVDGRRRDDHGGQRNGGVVGRATDDATPSLTTAVCENHWSSMNSDNDLRTQCRPESVWLEYLYAWNPLAAGNATRQQSE